MSEEPLTPKQRMEIFARIHRNLTDMIGDGKTVHNGEVRQNIREDGVEEVPVRESIQGGELSQLLKEIDG